MDIPVGQDVEIPVRLVLVGEPLSVVAAVLLRVEAGELRLRVEPIGDAAVGRRAVAAVGGEKLAGRITAIEGTIVTVAREETHGTDDRSAPRVRAPLSVTWWSAGDTAAFLSGRTPPSPGRTADADDLSISGLRFTAPSDPPAQGAQLLLALRLDPAGRAHRLVAVVRRVAPGPAGWSIAAEFADMDDAAFDALSDVTLRNL